MTNEEAIKELKEDRALYESDIVKTGDGTPEGQLMLAIDMAIEALEKQIPKKPKRDKEYPLGRVCPKCSAYLGNVQFMSSIDDYCMWCGQALDWSDYE